MGVSGVAAVSVAPECWFAGEFGYAGELMGVDLSEVVCEFEEAGDLGLPESVDALLDVADIADRGLPWGVGGPWVAFLVQALPPQP